MRDVFVASWFCFILGPIHCLCDSFVSQFRSTSLSLTFCLIRNYLYLFSTVVHIREQLSTAAALVTVALQPNGSVFSLLPLG